MLIHSKRIKQVTLCLAFLLLLVFFGPKNSKAASNEFEIKNGVLIKYTGSSSNVTIPNTVKTIGDSAFMSKSKIKSVTIPTSVTKIEEFAFAYCYNLATINIPDTVTSIGNSAFNSCIKLKTLKLPNKLKSISENTFSGCRELKSIIIPDSVTEIKPAAFSGCEKLISVTIPKNVKNIDGAFANCSSLKTINIPDKVTSIGESTFNNCTSLESITLPKQITSIGYAAFADCSSLKSITIPENVTEIGDYAFIRCNSLKSIVFPKYITVVGDYILSGSINLESVSMPTTVTKIGTYAFANTRLTNFTMPSSIQEIGVDAFYDTPWLEKGLENSPYLIVNNILFDASNTSGIATVPKGVIEIAAGAFRNSSAREVIIPESVKKIGSSAFTSNTIKKVTLAEGLKEIGESSFTGSYITSITIPKSVTSIGANAFSYCRDLESIIIPEGITKIEDGSFSFCERLKSITIPKSVVTIGKDAFSHTSSLIDIQIAADNPNYSGAGSLLLSKDKKRLIYCTLGIKDIVIPEGVETIDSYAFNESGVTKITLPSTLKELGDNTFYDCSELTEIHLPSSLVTYGIQKLEFCKKLNFSVFESKGVANYSSVDGVLYNGDKTTLICDPTPGSVVVQDHVTSISDYAFPNVTDAVTIPKSVINISNNLLNLNMLSRPEGEDPFLVYGYQGSAIEKYCADNRISFLAYDASYSISYVLNGGTNSIHNPKQYDYTTDTIIFEEATRKGYAFLYWYEDISLCEDGCHRGERKVSELPVNSLGNIELIAKWEKISLGKTVIMSAKKSFTTQISIIVQPIKEVTGYEVLYAKNSSFTSGKKTQDSKTSNITIKSLTKGTTYYVKVRAYRLDSAGNKIYGSYSNVYKIKM